MDRVRSQPSTGITPGSIYSKQPFKKGRRRRDCFNNRFNFWMRKGKTFVIERITPTDILKDGNFRWRSEEHTSELQSRSDLVCRLLLEKKKTALLHET